MEMDISKQLHAYEVEYHVLQDELLDSAPLPDDSERLDKVEKTNAQLKKQNMDLLEKLQVREKLLENLSESTKTGSLICDFVKSKRFRTLFFLIDDFVLVSLCNFMTLIS